MPDFTRHAIVAAFSTTVAQNTDWKGCLMVLWRKCCWAARTPGRPLARETKRKVVSLRGGFHWNARSGCFDHAMQLRIKTGGEHGRIVILGTRKV